MTYVADPADGTRPLDGDDASGGAAELRALKAYLQTLITGGTNPTGYSWQGGRNRLRNGDVRFDSHNVGVGTIGDTVTQKYGPDGYKIVYSQLSKLAIGRAATGVIAGGVLGPLGCPNYTVVATNTAVAAPAAADFFALEIDIEDTYLFDFNFGQSSARQMCFSFWFRASIAGDYACAIRNITGPRSYPTKFNIPTANVWTLVNLSVPGDVAASLMTFTGATGLRLWFDLGSGSNFNAVAPNQWNANDLFKHTGCVEPIKTLGASIHISKVQFEPDNFTPFEFLHYHTAQAWQQRYFQSFRVFTNCGPVANYVGYTGLLTTTMRTSPTSISYADGAGALSRITTNAQGNGQTIAGGAISASASVVTFDFTTTPAAPGNWVFADIFLSAEF